MIDQPFPANVSNPVLWEMLRLNCIERHFIPAMKPYFHVENNPVAATSRNALPRKLCQQGDSARVFSSF